MDLASGTRRWLLHLLVATNLLIIVRLLVLLWLLRSLLLTYFAHIEHHYFIVDGCRKQHPIMAPTHLTELRLEIITTGHVALGSDRSRACGTHPSAYLNAEEVRRPLKEP